MTDPYAPLPVDIVLKFSELNLAKDVIDLSGELQEKVHAAEKADWKKTHTYMNSLKSAAFWRGVFDAWSFSHLFGRHARPVPQYPFGHGPEQDWTRVGHYQRLAMLILMDSRKISPASLGLTADDIANLNLCFDPKQGGSDLFRQIRADAVKKQAAPASKPA